MLNFLKTIQRIDCVAEEKKTNLKLSLRINNKYMIIYYHFMLKNCCLVFKSSSTV